MKFGGSELISYVPAWRLKFNENTYYKNIWPNINFGEISEKYSRYGLISPYSVHDTIVEILTFYQNVLSSQRDFITHYGDICVKWFYSNEFSWNVFVKHFPRNWRLVCDGITKGALFGSKFTTSPKLCWFLYQRSGNCQNFPIF